MVETTGSRHVWKNILRHQSYYNNVQYCIRLNGLCTNWFKVKHGLKQGCLLSPLLFNISIKSLADTIKHLGLGVDVDGEKIGILLNADDLVLISDNEADLQAMIDILNNWCENNKINVNAEKSKVAHFRNPSVQRSSFTFSCGDHM